MPLLLVGLAPAAELFAAAAPGFTITASNVSISGKGTAETQFTVKSVNGFAGKVGIRCKGPDPNLTPYLVLPSCSHPDQLFVITAGGSGSGTMGFYPPWTDTTIAAARSGKPPDSIPLVAGIIVGFGLLGLRARKFLTRQLAMLAAAASLTFLAGTLGCIGSGGLAMTPGT